MKSYFQYMLAGVFGGLIVLGGVQFINFDKTDNPKKEDTIFPVSISTASTTLANDEFVESAKKSTPAVVYIFAEESNELARERSNTQRKNNQRRNPFFDLFGFDDFFGGQNFYAPKSGSGSGVIYSQDGYIITNNHVVGFADKITVTDYQGNKYSARKIGTDEITDLAVIKIDGAKNLTAINMGNSDKVNVGEWVLAVGNPFGYLTSTVTAGIVSAKGRSLDVIPNKKKIEEFIQTDAAINPGNSGGALVNLKGELIGINTAIATPTGVFAGYSFAIPSNLVIDVVRNIIESGNKGQKANLGVAGYDVTTDLVTELNLLNKTGFYIDSVEKGSSAQMGGLLPGDIIIAINDNSVIDYDDIEKYMRFINVGDKVSIKINRNGKEKTIPIKLKG